MDELTETQVNDMTLITTQDWSRQYSILKVNNLNCAGFKWIVRQNGVTLSRHETRQAAMDFARRFDASRR